MKKLSPSVNIYVSESVNLSEEQERSYWDDPEFCRRLTELIFSAEIPIQ